MSPLVRFLAICAAASASVAHADADSDKRGDDRLIERTSMIPRHAPATPPPAWTTNLSRREVIPRSVPVYSIGPHEQIVLTVAHRAPTLRWSASF